MADLDAVVDWINRSTRRGLTVLSAVPPGFERYATVVIPDEEVDKQASDRALVEVLQAHTAPQSWWLGYLDTGVADVIRPDDERVRLYVEWPYVLLQGRAEEALQPREHTPWHSALPELILPADRSWLVSTMWDDEWRCLGGPASLVDALLSRPEMEARAVTPDEDATPPGRPK